MSKNNSQEYLRKMEQQRQHFGLRKLSVDVASVLLGITFVIGGGTVAHASDNDPVGTSNVTTTMTGSSIQEGSTTSESTDKEQTAANVDTALTSSSSEIINTNSDTLLATQPISVEKGTELPASQTGNQLFSQQLTQQFAITSAGQSTDTQDDSDKIIHVICKFRQP